MYDFWDLEKECRNLEIIGMAWNLSWHMFANFGKKVLFPDVLHGRVSWATGMRTIGEIRNWYFLVLLMDRRRGQSLSRVWQWILCERELKAVNLAELSLGFWTCTGLWTTDKCEKTHLEFQKWTNIKSFKSLLMSLHIKEKNSVCSWAWKNKRKDTVPGCYCWLGGRRG